MGKKKSLQKPLTIPLTRGGHQQSGTCLRGNLSLCASVSLSHRLIYIQVRVHVYGTYVLFKIVLRVKYNCHLAFSCDSFPSGVSSWHRDLPHPPEQLQRIPSYIWTIIYPVLYTRILTLFPILGNFKHCCEEYA